VEPGVSEPTPTPAINRLLMKLQELAQEWGQLFPQAASSSQHWLQVLSQVQAHLVEGVLRVAVVGTVKAGKSTLVNALVGQDVLRRGAGILTAMVTRVTWGEEPRAVLKFKSWDEIHAEISQSLGLLPSARMGERTSPLDLREAADRELLAEMLAEGEAAGYWVGGGLNQDYLLLKAYLEGYPAVSGYLAAGTRHTLAGPSLADHRELVSREATAVYLKDVGLTIPGPWLPAGVELGDCQGSDSPMPQHLAQVLTYLLRSDLVLYVISSRVGLRQADFQFLGELKRMGLAGHIYFLINVDLTEHRDLKELQGLVGGIREELAGLVPNPPVYAFSALGLLLERRQARGEELEQRESALLSVWSGDSDLLGFSQAEALRFCDDFTGVIRQLKDQQLSGGSLAQVGVVARGIREQLSLAQEMLCQDQTSFQELTKRLAERRRPLEATRHSLSQTLRGAGEQLKQVIRGRVSGALDLHGGLAASLAEVIRGYEPAWGELAPAGNTRPLRLLLYQMFQEFQKEVGRFVSSEFTLKVMEFIREQEEWLRGELNRTCSPLSLALQEALTLYYRETAALGLSGSWEGVKLEFLRPPGDLAIPVLSFQVAPGWRWAGEAYVRSGVEVLRRAWRYVRARLGLAPATDPQAQTLGELQGALAAMKRWLLEQARLQVLDYGERLKFQYFFPLIDHYVRKQEEHLDNYLGSLMADLEGLAAASRQAEEERGAKLQRVRELLPLVQEMERELSLSYGG